MVKERANHLNLLKQCLQNMGATPADRSRVPAGDDGEGIDDPASIFFN